MSRPNLLQKYVGRNGCQLIVQARDANRRFPAGKPGENMTMAYHGHKKH